MRTTTDLSETDVEKAYDFEFNIPALTKEPRLDNVRRNSGLTVRGVR
ncbi:MAG: hypothetical protein K6E35_07990 [Bacteroidales bacterium]|nr:hypothetical protein [Bacteroidales bacterium]